jgi:DNA-binding PucR family transcriptional regulator
MMRSTRGEWVRELHPTENAPRVAPVCPPTTVAEAVVQVGTAPVDWAIEVADAIAVRSIEADSLFGSDVAAVRTLRWGIESSALQILRGIDAGDLPVRGLTPEAEQQIHEYVHRRVPLERLWASIRLGHAWFSEYFMAACRDLVALGDQPEQLQLVSRILFEYVDAFAAGVGDAYHGEERRWLASAAAARDETIRAILAGEAVDIRAASRALDYEIHNRYHLGIILHQSHTGAADATALHKAASTMLGALGATTSVVMPVGRAEVWAWGGSRTPFRGSTLHVADKPGVRILTGSPGRGVEGFRRTHLQAREAARVSLLADRDSDSSEIITYSSVSLLALLSVDPRRAREFIRDELGRLALDDPQARSLRETLLAYLDNRRSPQAAAAQLFVAKNTVLYRLRRAEELLGHSIDERQLELWVALMLIRSLGIPE